MTRLLPPRPPPLAPPLPEPSPKRTPVRLPAVTPASTDGIMVRLRQHTAALHAATEDLSLMTALVAPTAQVRHYQRYLAALYQVYVPLEPMLYAATTPTMQQRLGVRPRLPALTDDLLQLGAPPRMAAARSSPAARALIDSPAAALGGFYVLEGASLGGRVIARRLRQALGTQADTLPWRFLDGPHPEPGAAWRRFAQGMATCAAAPGHQDDAILTAAVGVFALVHTALATAPDAPVAERS